MNGSDRGANAADRGPADPLARAILSCARRLASSTAELLQLIERFDRIEGFRAWGCRSTADWLAWQAGVRPITAREYVRVARALRSLPKIRSAFARGEVSFSKVRAITRVAEAKSERSLLRQARVSTAAELEQIVRTQRVARAVRDPGWAIRHRSVRSWIDEEGMMVVLARMPVAEGVEVTTAIRVAEPRVPVTAETGDDLDGPGPGERRRADALVEVARAYLRAGAKGRSGSRPALAVVHVEAGSGTVLMNDAPIATATAERVLCDAVLARATHAPGGRVDLGRLQRIVSPALRRSIGVRDRERCRFPGCRNSRYLDAHHIQSWTRQGKTAIDNLVLLCTWHHRLVHEGGFVLWMDEHGLIDARAPDGRPLSERGPPEAAVGA